MHAICGHFSWQGKLLFFITPNPELMIINIVVWQLMFILSQSILDPLPMMDELCILQFNFKVTMATAGIQDIPLQGLKKWNA